jgi:anthranilate phosphoribosyltransferase
MAEERLEPVQLAGLVIAMNARGITADEIAGGVDALRARMSERVFTLANAIDTCGTGGDGKGSFNVSTAAAIVAAAAGATVAKHGNRAASSACGSADLLKELGVPMELDAESIERRLNDDRFAFLFAPRFHPALRFAAPVRRALGVRTIFNFLGPLLNPASVRRGVVGVGSATMLPVLANAAHRLGHARTFFVHGARGYDELTLFGENRVIEVTAEGCAERTVSAADVGLATADESALRGGDAPRNAAILRALLGGEKGAVRDTVLFNTAFALVAAGVASDPRDGVARGAEAIDSGTASTLLSRIATKATAGSQAGGR